jgi:hypothetical protein
MQGQVDYLHQILDIVTPVAILAFTVVGLLVKGKVAESALKNLKAASELKEELIAHNSKVAQDLAVHQADDRGNFSEIRSTQNDIRASLQRIEKKVTP